MILAELVKGKISFRYTGYSVYVLDHGKVINLYRYPRFVSYNNGIEIIFFYQEKETQII